MKRIFLTSQVQHVAHQIAKELGEAIKQKAVFIDTAIRDKAHKDLSWHETNRSKMEEAGFSFDFYNIAGKSNLQIREDLGKYHLMYVEGGNPFYLLQEAQQNDFGLYVKERIDQGLIYIGTSVGSIILGPETAMRSRPGKAATDFNLQDTKGFNVVNFSVMPHWGDEEKKNSYLQTIIPQTYKDDYPYTILTDTQYIEMQDDWYKIVDVANS